MKGEECVNTRTKTVTCHYSQGFLCRLAETWQGLTSLDLIVRNDELPDKAVANGVW